MRTLKIFFIAAAAAMLLTSCYKRQFEPTFGNTTVEFVSPNQEIFFSGEYINIPIRMTEQTSTGAQAVVKFIGGTAVMLDGTSHEAVEFTNDQAGYEKGGDFIITSNTVNIGAYDEEVDGDGLPSNNLEIRVPDYRNMQTLTLSFEIVSGNAGPNSTTTVVVSQPTEVLIDGTWTIAGNAFTISQTDNGYEFTYNFQGVPLTFGAERDGNNLTIDTAGPRLEDLVIEQGGPAYDVDIICWVFNGESISQSNVVLSFTDAENLTVTNGMFMGFADPREDPSTGQYLGLIDPIAAGTPGTK